MTGAGVVAAAVLLLAACGSEGDGETQAEDASAPTASSSDSASASATATPTATTSATRAPAPAGTPACTAVWQAGRTLPKGYAGCADAGGLLVAPDVLGCSSGQGLVRYDERFWAVAGGPVQGGKGTLAASRDYQKVVSTCRG